MRCGRCCTETEMLLSCIDIQRLEQLGYKVRAFAWFDKTGYARLRNRRRHCVFYNVAEHSCKVYPYRPEGQKVPFYIEFTPYSSVTGDLSWVSLGIENVTFEILPFNATSSWKYPDLKIVSSHQFIDENGTYAVTGIVQNTGSLSTGRVWVVATFYDTSGKVVAAGYTNFLTPNQLQPSQTTSFIVYPLDCTPELSQRIANYSLTIQTEGPIMPEIIYPSSCASPSTSPTVSNPPETPSIELSPSPQIETSQTFPAFYIAVIVIIAVILLAAAIMLRRR